jgi:predicted nuclease with TOPRIM domain
MANRNIYLPDELHIKLKEIPNVSGLIACLLLDYFKNLTPKNKDELLEKAEEIKKQKEKLLKEADEQLSKITLEVKKTEEIEEDKAQTEEEKAHRLANKISSIVNDCENLFGIKLSSEEAEQYINGSWNNLKEYLIFLEKWN